MLVPGSARVGEPRIVTFSSSSETVELDAEFAGVNLQRMFTFRSKLIVTAQEKAAMAVPLLSGFTTIGDG